MTNVTLPEFFGGFTENRKKDLIDWINRWRDLEKLGFTLDLEHFFLEGRHLDFISGELISNAEREVLIVNPFIEKCHLSETLREAKKRGVEVEVLTRPPEDKNEAYKQKKIDYHRTLKDEGIKLFHHQEVHAKLIVVDRAVAIASSMNFYSGSSGGKSWEAGVVSLGDTVVASIVSSVLKLLRSPDSKEI